MKLFLTYYRLDKDILDIYNGFSFGCHHIKKADYKFITDNVDISKLKGEIEKYSKIYYSVTFPYQLKLIEKIVDDRWVIGGPYIDIIEGKQTTLCKELGVEEDDIFTSYWDKWLSKEKISPRTIRYSANCKTHCYWNRCKYCGGVYGKKKVERNILKVLKQLPEQDGFCSYVNMVNGSIDIEKLKILCQYDVPERTVIKAGIRPDKEVMNIIERSEKLRGIDFGIGVENLSQKGFDVLDKGFTLNDALSSAKSMVVRGAYVSFSLVSSFGIYDEVEIDKSLKWIGDNLRSPFVRFWDTFEYEWPNEQIAAEFGPYEIKENKNDNLHFSFDKVIRSRRDIRISDKIVNTLRSMGFVVISRLDEIKRHNDIMKKINNSGEN